MLGHGHPCNMVRTAKLFSDEVICGTERLEHTSYRVTVSGIRELHCITHTEDVHTGAKLHPFQDVMELAKRQRGTTKTIRTMKQLVRSD